MWLVLLLPIGFISLFIFGFTFTWITCIKDKGKRNRISKIMKRTFLILEILILVTLTVFEVGGFRMDTAGGQHIIIPTAVDTDFWGNYKMYYKTTSYESNQSEGYYMIKKENSDLAEQAAKYMKERKQIIVYYDRYIGFKGITSPNESPITKMEELGNNAY